MLRNKGIKCSSLARPIYNDDYYTFQYIFGMDANNVKSIKGSQPKDSKSQIYLFGEL